MRRNAPGEHKVAGRDCNVYNEILCAFDRGIPIQARLKTFGIVANPIALQGEAGDVLYDQRWWRINRNLSRRTRGHSPGRAPNPDVVGPRSKTSGNSSCSRIAGHFRWREGVGYPAG